MASARHRTRSGPVHTGRYRYGSNSAWSYRNVTLSSEVMDDVVGNPLSDNGMVLTYNHVRSLATANATGNYLGGSGSTMENFPVVPTLDMASLTIAMPALPSWDALAATAASRTNPSRPAVLLPVALFELRELPSLVRKFGNGILAAVGDANLRWQFGVAPMISDVKKLAMFQGAVERRARETSQLLDNGGLRSGVELYYDVKTRAPTWQILVSTPFTVRSRREVATTRKVWASCRWKPAKTFAALDQGSQSAYMRRVLLGLTAGQITQNVWNALPWSWLIDWFSNAGDLLQASNNNVGVLSGSCCIMQHLATTCADYCYSTGSRKENLTFNNDYNLIEAGSKARYLAAPAFGASVPFLTGRQLSILGSLAATRRRG